MEEIEGYVRSNTLSTILRHFGLNETYEKIRSDVDHVLYSEFRIRKEEAKAERAQAEALAVLQKTVKKNNREGAFNNFFELKSHCEMKASKIHNTDYLKPGEVVKNRLLEYYALMSLTLFRSVSMVSRNVELSQWTAPSLYYLKDRRAMDQYKFCDDDGILRISLPETNSMPLFGYNKGATTRIPREIQNAINRVISKKDNLDPNLFVIHPISQEELIDARDPVYQMFFLRNAHIYFS